MSTQLNPSKAAWRDVIGDALHHVHCNEHRQWQSCPTFRTEIMTGPELRAIAEAVHAVAGRLETAVAATGDDDAHTPDPDPHHVDRAWLDKVAQTSAIEPDEQASR